MMNEMALHGIREYGLKWRAEISFHGQPARLADEDNLKVGDVAVIRDAIVRDVRNFLEGRASRALDQEARDKLAEVVEEVEMCDDDPHEVKRALNDLYDQFDFYRVCVLR
jgi:hypothetical protein